MVRAISPRGYATKTGRPGTGWTTESSNAYDASVMNNMSPVGFYQSLSAEYGKPILFTEIGYQSINDTNELEGAFGTSNWVDSQQQSQALEAFFSTFSRNGGNWFEGAYLWNWEANPSGVLAGDFSVQGKPGVNIVDFWYGLKADAQSGAQVPDTATGSSNSISVGNGDALNVVGDGNQISLGANAAVNVSGQGNTVTMTGGNNLVQTSGATEVTLNGAGATVILNGDGDSITTAKRAQDGLAVSSNNSTVTLSGASDALTLTGNGSSINLTGTNDTLSVLGTGNTINVSGVAAVIQASGANLINLAGDGGSASVEGDNDNITVNGSGGSLSIEGAGAVVTVGDGASSISLDNGNYQVTVGNGNNTISAGDGNDTVKLGDGVDTVTVGSGTDAITLGNGSDAVTLGGNDLLTSNVSAGDSSNSATATISDTIGATSQSNEIAFTGANSDQLWFSRSNNDLLVNVIGTSSEIDIAGWLGGNETAVQSFAAADGKLLSSDDVNALVEAMASFSPPAAGSTTLPESYQNQLQSAIAANWH